MLRSVTKVYTFEIRVYTFTLYIYKVLNMKESKNMASYNTQVKAMNLYNKSKRDGLDTDCLRLKSPFHHDRHCSIFTPQPVNSGGGGMSTFALVAGGLTLAAAGVGIYAATGGFKGSSGAQGAGGPQVNSKATIQTMRNAADSGDEKTIKMAIKAGEDTSKGLDGQIQSNQGVADKAKADMDTVKPKIETLEKTTIPDLNKDLAKLNGEEQQLQGQLDKLNPKDDGYEAKRIDLQQQIEKKKAEIQDKKDEIEKAERQLEDYKQFYDNSKTKYDDAARKVKELQPKKEENDTELARLREKLANIQAATKPDGATSTGSPAAATVPTAPSLDKLGADLLKDMNSTGTTPAVTTSEGSKTDTPKTPSVIDAVINPKKDTLESFSSDITSAKKESELTTLDDTIDAKFGKGSENSIKLHKEIEQAKLKLKGADGSIVGSGL